VIQGLDFLFVSKLSIEAADDIPFFTPIDLRISYLPAMLAQAKWMSQFIFMMYILQFPAPSLTAPESLPLFFAR